MWRNGDGQVVDSMWTGLDNRMSVHQESLYGSGECGRDGCQQKSAIVLRGRTGATDQKGMWERDYLET